MKKILLGLVILFSMATACFAQEKDYYGFIQNYINRLHEIDSIQKAAAKETKKYEKDPLAPSLFESYLASDSKMILLLHEDINALNGIGNVKKFNGKLNSLISGTVQLDQEEIKQRNTLIGIDKQILRLLLNPPQNDQDTRNDTKKVQNLLIEVIPQLEALMSYTDESLFKTRATLVRLLLIDPQPDNKGHMSHLDISVWEKKQLLNSIRSFGPILNQTSPPWVVSEVIVLKDFLSKKGYKCKDEWSKQ